MPDIHKILIELNRCVLCLKPRVQHTAQSDPDWAKANRPKASALS